MAINRLIFNKRRKLIRHLQAAVGKSTAEYIGQELRINETVGAHLKKWREQNGISLGEVESKLHVPFDQYIAWELGAISPKARQFCAVVASLGNVYEEASGLTNRLMNEGANLRASIAAMAERKSRRCNFEALGFVHKFAA